jgi:SAM-dependent methyltransferase
VDETATSSTIEPWVLALMQCPRCGGALASPGEQLVCKQQHRWPTHHGLHDFMSDDLPDDAAATLENFGYEWAAFPAIQAEDAAFWERYSRDLDPAAVAGKLVVDVGCGKGRFSWFLAQQARHLVAFDGSGSVGIAAGNLAPLANTTVFRADLHHAPLRDGSFDLVSCIGVLHYVPDPNSGFAEVARLIAPGGTLLLSVYSRPENAGVRARALSAAAFVRRFTPKVPKPLLRALSAPLAAALYGAIVLPGRMGEAGGVRRLDALPLQTYRRRPLRSLWLDTFNRLHAPFEHRFVREDIDRWLADAGLVLQSVREDAGWMVVARRP